MDYYNDLQDKAARAATKTNGISMLLYDMEKCSFAKEQGDAFIGIAMILEDIRDQMREIESSLDSANRPK